MNPRWLPLVEAYCLCPYISVSLQKHTVLLEFWMIVWSDFQNPFRIRKSKKGYFENNKESELFPVLVWQDWVEINGSLYAVLCAVFWIRGICFQFSPKVVQDFGKSQVFPLCFFYDGLENKNIGYKQNIFLPGERRYRAFIPGYNTLHASRSS